MRLPFVKMHGLGNDFVVIDDRQSTASAPLSPELARAICDRRFGIGCDQILWLKPASHGCDFRMDILNADGSVAEMCGNGVRAAVDYVARGRPGGAARRYQVETLAGLIGVDYSESERIRVDMGAPRLGAGLTKGASERLDLAGEVFELYEVSMGNPHAVIFVSRLDRARVEEFGPLIERHGRFPNRTNVEFVRVAGPQALEVLVWERGAGLTMACGTGACAAAVAALQLRQVSGPVQVKLPGGTLEIEWSGGASPVFMTGPAAEVFRGELDLSALGFSK